MAEYVLNNTPYYYSQYGMGGLDVAINEKVPLENFNSELYKGIKTVLKMASIEFKEELCAFPSISNEKWAGFQDFCVFYKDKRVAGRYLPCSELNIFYDQSRYMILVQRDCFWIASDSGSNTGHTLEEFAEILAKIVTEQTA